MLAPRAGQCPRDRRCRRGVRRGRRGRPRPQRAGRASAGGSARRLIAGVPGPKDAKVSRALGDAAVAGGTPVRVAAVAALAASGDEIAAEEALRVVSRATAEERPALLRALSAFRDVHVHAALT